MTTRYDEIAYPSAPFRQTHPDRLAAHALLFGLPAAPIDHCRVLEIAAGDGANLIPMALGHPDSHFVGFDLARAPIERGQMVVSALDLGNIDLFQADILDVDLGGEPFDYIIAHGVYSWTPALVREAIMDLIGRKLALGGVAFVSYNALPGCRVRQALRDLMLFAVAGVGDPFARVEGARARLKDVVDTFPRETAFNALLIHEAERLLERPPEVLIHDELGEAYHPVHINDFSAHARRHGLQFLTEAEGVRCGEGFAPPSAIDHPSFDVLAHAQDIDFRTGRNFRQNLLVRDHIAIDRRPAPDRLLGLHVSSPARRAETGRFSTGAADFEITDAALGDAVERIGAVWPSTVPIASVIEDPVRAAAMLKMYWVDAVELHSAPSTFPIIAGERPKAGRLARLQAGRGQTMLTTLRHGVVNVEDAFSRAFIAGLDGARTRVEIARDLAPTLGGTESQRVASIDSQLGFLARTPILEA